MQRQIRPESFDHNQKCLCEEADPQHHIEFEHGETKTLHCTSCQTEKIELGFTEKEEISTDIGIADDITEEEPPTLDTNLQINLNNIPVDSYENAASRLREGHHIAWVRDKGKLSEILSPNYSHHAIVERNDGTHLSIIHFAQDKNNDNNLRIHRSQLKLNSNEDMKYSSLFCIQYPQPVIDENPSELVLQRARAKLGEESYNPATNNCESFANYCKTGISVSLQAMVRLMSVITKLRNALMPLCTLPRVVVWIIQISSAEVVEGLVSLTKHLTYINAIGFTLYVIAEGFVVSIDIYKLYEGRRNKRITDEKEFTKAIVNRIVLGFGRVLVGTAFSIPAGIAGTVAGGVIGGLIPIPGSIAVGAFVGGVVCSITGGVGAVAALEGSRTIIWSFWNSRDVTSIDQLSLGDHIVLRGRRFLHPRCHAIVTEIDTPNDRIRVVRNRHQQGVIEEYIPFENMKRISYSFASCYPSELVIRRARSHLGDRRYNIATFNCKTFARKQKMREEFNF